MDLCYLRVHVFLYMAVNLQGPIRKKRKLTVSLPSLPPQQADNCISEFNLGGRIRTYQEEVGDDATSCAYLGAFNGVTVAVKQLKLYTPQLASALIQAYKQLFKLKHDNLVQVYGICPNKGYIVMGYCHIILGNCTLRTFGDLLLHYGDHLPVELRIMALSDIAEGRSFTVMVWCMVVTLSHLPY